MIDDLLVGDIVLIEAGNKIPADGLLLEGDSVECFEGAMTGESDLLKNDSALLKSDEQAEQKRQKEERRRQRQEESK